MRVNRLLRNVFEAADARQKQAKKRRLCRINAHSGAVLNTAAATQIVSPQPVKRCAVLLLMLVLFLSGCAINNKTFLNRNKSFEEGQRLIETGELELGLIRTHTQVGYNILRNIEFPWPIAEIVLQHHERMDGSGYPAGLAGDEILLEARIVGVADVVEALSSHRPYRPALGIPKALDEITVHRGTLYDPAVADACVRVLKNRGFEFEEGPPARRAFTA